MKFLNILYNTQYRYTNIIIFRDECLNTLISCYILRYNAWNVIINNIHVCAYYVDFEKAEKSSRPLTRLRFYRSLYYFYPFILLKFILLSFNVLSYVSHSVELFALPQDDKLRIYHCKLHMLSVMFSFPFLSLYFILNSEILRLHCRWIGTQWWFRIRRRITYIHQEIRLSIYEELRWTENATFRYSMSRFFIQSSGNNISVLIFLCSWNYYTLNIQLLTKIFEQPSLKQYEYVFYANVKIL